ncbi:MAG: hypothetical protein IKQ35_00630 [Bacilli bacterium]|nr:hypothetical protein [Bacilli bacterium]
MEKLEQQIRTSSMLDVIELDRRRGIYTIADFDNEARSGIYRDVLDKLLEKSPLEEEDLVVRALMTKNLLKYVDISMRYVMNNEPEKWVQIKQMARDGVLDPTFETCDNPLAVELQHNNYIYARNIETKRSTLFDTNEVLFLTNKLKDISYETYNEGLLKSEDKTK